MTLARVQRLPAAAFNAYQDKRLAKLAAFAPLICLDRWLAERGVGGVPRYRARLDRVAFHPWRRGLVETTADDADDLDTFARLGWLDDGPLDIDGVVERALVDFAALQNPSELTELLTRVAARPPRTIVEIGTSCGGLLFAIAQVAAPDATLVSVDLPERMDTPAIADAVPQVLAGLVQRTQTLHVIRERSTIHGVRDDVIAHLGGRPLDLLLVDGDHSYGGVRSDVEMYGPLVGPGGTIALHDVATRPSNSGRGFDVGLYWDELQAALRRGEVIIDPDGVPGIQSGLPEDRRAAALGWGLITV